MTVSVLLADLHRAGLHRPLERQQALAGFGADAEDALPPPQRLVFRVEQSVLLEAAAAKRRSARRENGCARFLRTAKSKLDFTLDHQRHGRPPERPPFITKKKASGLSVSR